VRAERAVYGILIVEGDGDAQAAEVPEPWSTYAKALGTQAVLGASLPHRTAAERQAIGAGFLGATTWQRVCSEFGIAWPPV